MNETLKRKLDEAAYQWCVAPDNDIPRYNRDFIDGALYMHTELISVINDLMGALELQVDRYRSRGYPTGSEYTELINKCKEALAKAKETGGNK